VPAVLDICGDLTYTIDAGDFNVYINYDIDLRVIIIYCDDFSVLPVGSYSYTITATLVLYPNCVNCHSSGGGTIVVVDPCTSAQMSAATPTNIIYQYSGDVVFTMPALTVTPEACSSQVIYTCSYMQGPYTGTVNMCEFSMSVEGNTCSASFDTLTGQYTFNCFSMPTFPPGTYMFTITAYIGSINTKTTFTMTLVSPCNDQTQPTIDSDPFYVASGYEYVVRSSAIVLPFDPATIGNLQGSLICGYPTIQILTGQASPDLAAVFQVDYSLQTLTIYTMDHTLHGIYNLVFKYFN